MRYYSYENIFLFFKRLIIKYLGPLSILITLGKTENKIRRMRFIFFLFQDKS
jgi:hypothetical protein